MGVSKRDNSCAYENNDHECLYVTIKRRSDVCVCVRVQKDAQYVIKKVCVTEKQEVAV